MGGHDNFRYITDRCLKGQFVAFSDIEELSDKAPELKQILRRFGIKSELAVPISANREIIGLMIIMTTRKRRDCPEELIRKVLWYRLNIFPIRIPPLRERTEDIPAFVEEYVACFSRHSGKRFEPIPRSTVDVLMRYAWPGNVRELRNLIERAVIVSSGGELCITVPNPPSELGYLASPGDVRPFAEMERAYLLHALAQAGWRIEGPDGAAEHLNLNASTLRSRMRKLDIRKQRPGLNNSTQRSATAH